jgi:hypothetical protein
MASMRMTFRILRPDHEKELRKAAAALPDDWSVEIDRNPGVGIEMRVTGAGVAFVRTFASGTPADLVGYLQDLSRQVP